MANTPGGLRAAAAYTAVTPSMPAQGGAAVTPHDTNPIDPPFRSLFVGGAGNVKVRAADGTTPTYTGVPAGYTLPIAGDMVFSTGTTATNITTFT